MRLVEDEQRAGAEVREPVAEGRDVILVDQQAVRDEEPRVRGPGIDAVATFLADPSDILLVEDLEDHPEAGLQLVPPLEQHRRWARDDDVLHLLAKQQFAGDQPRLDRLAETDVVGDEEVHPRQPQGLAERLELVRVDPDSRSERGLEQVRVSGGDAVPAEGMEVGGEDPRIVEPALGHVLPGLASEEFRVHLLLPEHLERLALCIVVQAREPHERGIVAVGRRDRFLDEVLPLAHADDLAGDGEGGGHGLRVCPRRGTSGG